jgi:predicted dienelactone hydrolase
MTMKTRLLPLLCLFLTSLAAAQSAPAFSSTTITLHDSARNKDLPLRVSYPTAPGKVPVIIFSHGAGGGDNGYLGLTQYWASSGYIVLQPTHEDSVQQRRAAGDNSASVFNILSDAKNPERWTARIADVELVLNSFVEIEQQVPAIKGRMDRDHIGVGGHSLGSQTAALIGGALILLPGKTGLQSFKDPRAKAILLLSPQGPDQLGFTDDSWTDMKLPMMVMTGSRDMSFGAQPPEWRTSAFKLAPSGDKYLLFIHDASHMSFSGRLAEGKNLLGGPAPKTDIDEAAIFDWVKTASLAFWDDYLKSDKEAKQFLASDHLVKDSGGEIRYDRK